MSDWEDTYDIGGDGVPDDFDSVMDFGDGTDAGADVAAFDAGAAIGDLVSPEGDLASAISDGDASIVDLDLGGLADVADIAVVAGVQDVGATDGDDGPSGDVDPGRPVAAPYLAHDLADVPDGSDPFAALVGRRLDDDELRNEIRHLRLRPPFAAPATDEEHAPLEEEPATPPR